MPFGIGPLEIVILLVILLIVAGPKAMPHLSRGLGSGMREVKDAISLTPRDDRAQAPSRPAPDEADPGA